MNGKWTDRQTDKRTAIDDCTLLRFYMHYSSCQHKILFFFLRYILLYFIIVAVIYILLSIFLFKSKKKSKQAYNNNDSNGNRISIDFFVLLLERTRYVSTLYAYSFFLLFFAFIIKFHIFQTSFCCFCF